MLILLHRPTAPQLPITQLLSGCKMLFRAEQLHCIPTWHWCKWQHKWEAVENGATCMHFSIGSSAHSEVEIIMGQGLVLQNHHVPIPDNKQRSCCLYVLSHETTCLSPSPPSSPTEGPPHRFLPDFVITAAFIPKPNGSSVYYQLQAAKKGTKLIHHATDLAPFSSGLRGSPQNTIMLSIITL